MPTLPKTKNAVERLLHIEHHLAARSKPEDVRLWCAELTDPMLQRDRAVMIQMLEAHCMALALTDWYENGDITRLKNLFYNVGKLEYIGFVEDWRDGPFRRFTYTNTMECMPLLLSDHPDLIQWCIASNFGLADSDHKDEFHTSEFFVKTVYLAMRRQWDQVEERCRRYIENPRRRPFSSIDIFEYQYLLALATGDIPAMETSLAQLVTPRALRAYSSSETAFTDGLIGSVGLIFAKLAWMNGYEVNINSLYIPQEWLPVQPLGHYEDEFDFMKAYTIDPTKGATPI